MVRSRSSGEDMYVWIGREGHRRIEDSGWRAPGGQVLERLRDQDDLQVADVGVGRAGLDEIAEAIEEIVAVVLVEICLRVQSEGPGAPDRFMIDDSAGCVSR